ncbi:class I SAM-dependent methyltransferase [Streptomyces sp. NPDC015501]|uniref:Indolepyruvate C-methyltransferase n=1 Tax=Streptomyces griseus TaxID=1911 RepID=IND1_STRGR|nr:RecName: Full=Indolepyruvate C-methyltransferase; AltName: Full=S-adenosylmethionine: indolepyruvate 3-methyltransferase [Streptomyces griseus]AJT38682.1 Ind1 [Streptomyces griseus subsp. griseus]
MTRTDFAQSAVASIFTGAIASHAAVLADDLGLFDALAKGKLRNRDLDRSPWLRNRIRISGALEALCRVGAVQRCTDGYELTDVGTELAGQVPVFRLWLGGYASVLAGQISIGADPATGVHGGIVAESSGAIGARYLDETIVNLLESLRPEGRICDIGCGTGARLLRVCRRVNQPGIGYDLSAKAVEAARETVDEARRIGVDIDVRQGDATALTQDHPDVDIVTQAFMTHHIAPDEYCAAVLRSYRSRFPRARYLVIFDTVPSQDSEEPEIFAPGFDYIHALQNMEPRSRGAARRMFTEAGYICREEVELAVPNSYAWVLEMRDREGPAS